jgi:type I restriction enzyme S subunit
VPESVFPAIKRYRIYQADIFISVAGSLGIVGKIPAELDGANLTENADRITDITCSRDYLLYVLLSPLIQNTIDSIRTVGAQPKLALTRIRKFAIPLPPTETERRAIATALGDVDALLGGLERLIAKKRDLKQAAMQQLLTGQTRLPGFHGEWEARQLGDVVDTDPENLGTDTRPNFAFSYIALEDVDRGVLRSHSGQVFRAAPSRARRKLRSNDVLVSTVRPNLQSHLLFRGYAGNWVCSTGFCVVRCREGVTNPGFVFNQLFAENVARQLNALLTGSNYPAINSSDVRALTIPFPEFAEQTAIAAVLSDMDGELASLEARRDKTHVLKQGMMQELLTGKTRLVSAGGAHA